MNQFLACHPNVFVIKQNYQIVVNVKRQGIVRLKVGKKIIDEENTGVFSTETALHSFTMPQTLLDKAGAYTLLFYPVKERKIYFSTLGEEESVTYPFCPITKEEGVRCLYIADVHCMYEAAVRTVAACGDTDLFIVNGDLGEVETEEDLQKMNAFIGEISGGTHPVVYGRGNHDTRGRLADRLPSHFACDNGNTYFRFSVGPISGVVLDCGEDKPDSHAEYGGYVCFEPWRRKETRALRRMDLYDRPYRIAVCHIPFFSKLSMHDDFDIERSLYASWGKELARMAPDFMVFGHTHRYQFFPAGDENSHFSHPFPAIGCVEKIKEEPLGCTTFTLYADHTEFRRVNSDGKVTEEFTLPRQVRA